MHLKKASGMGSIHCNNQKASYWPLSQAITTSCSKHMTMNNKNG